MYSYAEEPSQPRLLSLTMAKSGVKKSNLKRAVRAARQRRAQAATRSKATRVLAQGAGALPTRAFGASKGNNVSIRRRLLHGLNARLPLHLGLPRPVGPYQVIRTSKLHTTNARVVIFTPIVHNSSSADGHPVYFHACGIEDVNAALAINGTNNAVMIDMPMTGLGSAADMVPAALTVQVMNGAALQTASGLFTMGRVSQQLDLGGETRTWDTFKTEFDSFFKPRLLTGGKLALRGVTCNAVPINMNEFSNFLPGKPHVAGPITWGPDLKPAALSPLVFTQSGDAVDITFLVTIEWRVRFDPFSPAAASHVFHPSTPDAVWNGIIGAASAAGHGVVDIADEVAELGFDAATGAAGMAGAIAMLG